MTSDRVSNERHKDSARNVIINRASLDLSDIIQSHDPEVHNLNNRVWDRLEVMAQQIEEHSALQHLRSPVTVSDDLPHAAQFLVDRLDDFERDALQEDDGEYVLRQFSGHVSPAIERLRDSLTAALAPAEQEGKLEACDQCQGSGYGGHPDSGAVCGQCLGQGAFAPTHPGGDSRVVAWLMESDGAEPIQTRDPANAEYGKVQGWSVRALVPLSSLEAVERELSCRDALIKDHLATILRLENRVEAADHRAETTKTSLDVALKALEAAEERDAAARFRANSPRQDAEVSHLRTEAISSARAALAGSNGNG